MPSPKKMKKRRIRNQRVHQKLMLRHRSQQPQPRPPAATRSLATRKGKRARRVVHPQQQQGPSKQGAHQEQQCMPRETQQVQQQGIMHRMILTAWCRS
jgi:hypothetical protein